LQGVKGDSALSSGNRGTSMIFLGIPGKILTRGRITRGPGKYQGVIYRKTAGRVHQERRRKGKGAAGKEDSREKNPIRRGLERRRGALAG